MSLWQPFLISGSGIYSAFIYSLCLFDCFFFFLFWFIFEQAFMIRFFLKKIFLTFSNESHGRKNSRGNCRNLKSQRKKPQKSKQKKDSHCTLIKLKIGVNKILLYPQKQSFFFYRQLITTLTCISISVAYITVHSINISHLMCIIPPRWDIYGLRCI